MKSEFLKSVYFIGIGGISMSSLALILKNNGVKVGGYDFKKSENTKLLEENGIKVNYTSGPNNQEGFDTVVYTAAVTSDHEEMLLAVKRNAHIFSRAELLGDMIKGYKHSIGVAGTHGKSTTTGMLSCIFDMDKKDATVLAGAVIPALNSTYRAGNGDTAIFEACEYKNSYHSMHPTIRLVLNCEHDHVDFFKDMGEVISSFKKYLDTPGDNGENIAIINKSCKNSLEAAKDINARVYTFSPGDKTADFYSDRPENAEGYEEYNIYAFGKPLCHVKPGVPGYHNVANSIAAAAAAYFCGVSAEGISKGLEEFGGVKRRFERVGITKNGAVIIDDYAHHPQEVTATLKSAKQVCKGKVYCVFQPHTYTRFKALMADFADALSLSDVVVMADIYAAREVNLSGVSSNDITSLLDNAVYCGDFDSIAKYINANATEGDFVITMGAGDIYKVKDLII